MNRLLHSLNHENKFLKNLVVFLVLLALVLFLSSYSTNPAQPESQLLSLPKGDAVEGRQAFRELKCFSCHRIAGDIEMPAPVTLGEGPTLGLRQARYKARYIADSIIFPSHVIENDLKSHKTGDSLSRMGDFSDSMTVKQLADLVAYLKQLDEEV